MLRYAACSSAVPVLAAVLLTTTPSLPAWGHGPNQVIQETFVFIDGTRITIEYRTTFGAILARVKLITADANGDGDLSASEKDALLKGFSADILARLEVDIDGTALDTRYVDGRVVAPPLRKLGDTASILMRLEGSLGSLPAGPHLLRVVDGNFSETVLGHIAFYVRAGTRTRDLNVSRDGRTLEWAFVHSEEPAGVPSPQSTSEMHTGQHAAGETADEAAYEVGTLAGFVQREDLTLGFVLAALVIAAGLGAAHALSPGHGKAMVAAYLIGSKGRIRDAVLLGGIVTLTHVSSVIVIGVLALVLTEYLAPQDLYPWLGFASGCLIFVIGYWLLARRALGLGHSHPHAHSHGDAEAKHDSRESHGHEHSHDHEKDHHHDRDPAHDHPNEHGHSHVPRGEVTLWSLLTLGISGGMVPCPSAMVVLLAAVAMHRIVFGLLLILVFSLGLAAVLILMGILAVTATRFMTRSARVARWARALPVASAGVIMLAGVMLAVGSLLSGGVLTSGS
jgi:ABC-type nickel/cobalt efflux system permease component RcnA